MNINTAVLINKLRVGMVVVGPVTKGVIRQIYNKTTDNGLTTCMVDIQWADGRLTTHWSDWVKYAIEDTQ